MLQGGVNPDNPEKEDEQRFSSETDRVLSVLSWVIILNLFAVVKSHLTRQCDNTFYIQAAFSFVQNRALFPLMSVEY